MSSAAEQPRRRRRRCLGGQRLAERQPQRECALQTRHRRAVICHRRDVDQTGSANKRRRRI